MTTSVETLITEMTTGSASFQYKKTDGSLRKATGTLKVDLIPADQRPTNLTIPTPTAPSINYFDLDAKAWRSFRRDSLIG